MAGLGLTCLLTQARPAHADVTLAKPGEGWEVFTSGRIGAFVELVDGDANPYDVSPAHHIGDGGLRIIPDATYDSMGAPNGGHVSASRVRSGYMGNILSLGVSRQLTESTKFTGLISIWAVSETDDRRTFAANLPDEREAYLKLESPGGTLVVGRARSLFSRGATEIDEMYGHGYGVGNPAGFDQSGPSGGHIGYGVMGSVFVAGVTYTTPSAGGLQLSVGYYDPAVYNDLYWDRSKLGRGEGEVTYDAPLGGNAKLHLFANGAYQKIYASSSADSSSVYGAGGGARLEVGPFHLGVSGHKGHGIGIDYFMQTTDAVVNKTAPGAPLRDFDAAYVQTQTVVGKFDFNVGWGITRVYQVSADTLPDPQNNNTVSSYLKSQMGISGVIVYHFTPYLHGALDYFRGDAKWWLGEEQVLNSFNAGMMLTW